MRAHRVEMALSAFAASAMLVAVSAAPMAAQEMDGRWMAFVGCWEPVSEVSEDGILCVQFADDGVEAYTMLDGEVATSDLMVADGSRQESSAEGCEGWESAEFSADGRRVFTRSEFVCGGEVRRTATGVMSLIEPTEWIDVRSVDVDGEAVAWVQRYRLVGPSRMAEEGVDDFTQDIGMALRASRIAAARTVELEHVREAATKIDDKAVEAWVAARGDRFDVDADALIELADAGVSASVIDVVVAVSFPMHFAIDEGRSGAVRSGAVRQIAGGGIGIRRGYGFGGRSFFWDPFYYGYSSYYSPYSYGRGFYGSPYGGYYSPTTVVVDRRDTGGRVYNGRGYRQGGSTGSASSGPSRVSGSGGSASSGGSSSGSGGSRSAKPRRSGSGY